MKQLAIAHLSPLRQPHRMPRVRRSMWVGTATVAVLAGIAYLAAISRKPAPFTERPLNAERILISSAMSLSAVRTEGGVSLTWDATAPVIRNARVGVLSVRDGGASREIPLNQSQLQAANLVYMPQSDRLEVTLEVFSVAGEALRESMIVAVAPQASQPQVARLPAAAPADPPRRRESSRDPTRTFVPPTRAAGRAASEAVLLSEPPPLQLAQATTSSAAPFRPVNTPLPTPPKPLAIQPPRVLRQVRPTLPSNVAALVRGLTHVRVVVKIDPQGKVTHAEALAPPTAGVGGFLTESALEAARAWTFIPARQGSMPLPGEMVISFAFGPSR